MSRDMVDRYRRVVGTVFFLRGGICFYLLLFLFVISRDIVNRLAVTICQIVDFYFSWLIWRYRAWSSRISPLNSGSGPATGTLGATPLIGNDATGPSGIPNSRCH